MLYILTPLFCVALLCGAVFSFLKSDRGVKATAATATPGAYLDLSGGTKFLTAFSGAQNENVYLGGYDGKPVKWRVLAVNDTTYGGSLNSNLLLFADYSLGSSSFTGADATGTSNATQKFNNANGYYGTSKVRAYLNGGYYLTSRTTLGESVAENDSLAYKLLSGLNGDLLSPASTVTYVGRRITPAGTSPGIRTVGNDLAKNMASASQWTDWSLNSNTSVQIGGAAVNTKTGVFGGGNYNSNTNFTNLATNGIVHTTQGDRLFLLSYDDIMRADYGFADENGIYLDQGLFANIASQVANYKENGYRAGYIIDSDAMRDSYVDGWPEEPVEGTTFPYPKSFAEYLSGSDNVDYWLRNTMSTRASAETGALCIWANHVDWAFTYSDSSSGVRPASVLDLSKVGYITPASIGANFASANTYTTDKPEYKLFVKDSDMGENSKKANALYSASGNTLKVSYNNPTGKTSGNITVLISDKTKSDGSVAYQAAKAISASATADHYVTESFTLPSSINMSNYNVSVLFTSDSSGNYTADGENATETIYASYTVSNGIPAPQDINGLEYDGNCKWIGSLGDKAPDWVITDIYCNTSYMTVEKIMYTGVGEDAEEEDVTASGTSGIVNAGKYVITMKLASGQTWSGTDPTADKTFTINIAQKDVGTLNPTVTYGTEEDGTTQKKYYAGTSSGNSETEGGFPSISLPTSWSIPGTIKWDDDQTLGETGNYNWTFTPTNKSYAKKTGSSQIVVTPVSISAISATLPASAGNIYTSTKLSDLLSKLTLTKTYNNATDPVPAAPSEMQWATGTKLEAGENKELTLELKTNSSVTCKVTIPKVLAVVPAELIVTLKEGSTVYTSTSLDDLKTMLTVKEKNNDGTDGETLETDKFDLPEDLKLTDGTNTFTVTHKHSEDLTVEGDVTITVSVAGVKSVSLAKDDTKLNGVTLWEGAGADTIKQYLKVTVVFDDGSDTEKVLDYTKDSFTVTIANGGEKNVLVAPTSVVKVTYGGKTSNNLSLTATAVVVTELTAEYTQVDTVYSSATIDDLELETYLTVNAKYNNDKPDSPGHTLEWGEYTVEMPKGAFSSTNNVLTVKWKDAKGKNEKTATFTVEVTDRAPSDVEATYAAPNGKNPTAVNSLDDLKAGLTVKLNYNDGGTPKTLKADEYTLEADENGLQENGNLKAGTRTITVKYNDDIYTTVEVTVDKAAVDIGGTSFTPTGESESGGGKLEPDGNGGFKGTYDPEGGFDVGIDPDDLPAGVTAKDPVYKKYTGDGKPEFNDDGTPKDPTKWKPVDKIDGAGDYIVEIDFDYDEDNFDEIPPVRTIVDIGKADVDASGTTVAPAGADSGLKPSSNGGYVATYKPGGNYEVAVDPESVPVGATPKTPVYKKYTGDGKPEFNSDGTPADPTKWVSVAKPDGVGDYICVVEFEPSDKDNYNEIEPVVLVLTLSDKSAVEIAATLEDGAAFTTANTLDELKAKLTATVTYDNGDEESVKIADLDISCNNLRDGNKFKAGPVSVTVKFTDEGGNEVSTTVNITVQKVKVAVPTFKGGLSYTGFVVKPTVDNFNGYDSALMTFVNDKLQSGTAVGSYKAVFALNDPENYEWATAKTLSKSVFAAAIYDEEVTLLANEVAVDWSIARAVLTATKTDGGLPEFKSESFMGAIADVITLKYYTGAECTEDQEVAADQLAKETTYYVKAELLDTENFELDASAAQYTVKSFSYTTPAKELTGFQKVLAVVKANWLWIVIAVVALILLIVIIACAVRASKKKREREERRLAEEKAERERKEEERERKEEERRQREEERRREEREERMAARMAQPQMMMPQMPQMPMQQSMPQSMPQQAQATMPTAAGGGSAISEAQFVHIQMQAELAALKAEQTAKELAELKAKQATEQQLAQTKLEMQFANMTARSGGEQLVQGGISLDKLTELIRTEVNAALNGRERTAQPAAADNGAAATQVPPDAVMTTVTTTKIDTTKKQPQAAQNAQAQAAAPARTVVRNVVAPMPVDDGRVFDVGGFYKPADPITDMGFTDDENKD